MTQGQKEIISIRTISCAFTVLALAIFKPFGFEVWQWEHCAHLLAIFAMGVVSCMVTESILEYLVRMPRSTERGVNYIIRRNLWFQCINTPLVALMICLYRHFVLSRLTEENLISVSNYLETLLIIAFCSFAIGLYWRFKFRSRYLAAELEETRMMNEQLQRLQQSSSDLNPTSGGLQLSTPNSQLHNHSLPSAVTLTGTTNETSTFLLPHLLYIEAVGNYVKVYHLQEGQIHADTLRATSKQMEKELETYPTIVRCHRAFLVNLRQVEQIVSKAGTMQLLIRHCHTYIPVSRSHLTYVKDSLKTL